MGTLEKEPVLRSDMRDQLDSDPDVIKQQDKVYYLETTVDFLDRVLRSLNSRGWDIKNAVEWNKLQSSLI